MSDRIVSAFAKWENQAWPYKFRGVMHVHRIAGGVPSNPRVIEGWIKTTLGAENGDLLRKQVSETQQERGVSEEEAVDEVASKANLNGFKRLRCTQCPPGKLCRDGQHELFIEGRQMKAAIKEAALVAAGAGKLPVKGWGKTAKGLKGFVAEHIQVDEDRLPLGVYEPSGIAQRFVQSRFGPSISYEEYVDEVELTFTVQTDWPFTEEQWAMLWLTGEQQGIGATRSQGYGRYVLKSWESLS